MKSENGIMTVEDAARVMGCMVVQVRRVIARGDITGTLVPGEADGGGDGSAGTWMIARHDLDEFIRRQTPGLEMMRWGNASGWLADYHQQSQADKFEEKAREIFAQLDATTIPPLTDANAAQYRKTRAAPVVKVPAGILRESLGDAFTGYIGQKLRNAALGAIQREHPKAVPIDCLFRTPEAYRHFANVALVTVKGESIALGTRRIHWPEIGSEVEVCFEIPLAGLLAMMTVEAVVRGAF